MMCAAGVIGRLHRLDMGRGTLHGVYGTPALITTPCNGMAHEVRETINGCTQETY